MSNIPINKGNYILETPEREALFHARMGAGWEAQYEEYRKNWTLYPARQYVSEYPLLLDIELSTVCNLQCKMCYTITKHFRERVSAALMDFALFTKILDEIGGKVPAIRLSLRGEPTLHPRFIDCIKYAKSKKIPEVSTLTNGSKLTKEFFIDVMKAGMDWITISVDGLGGMYESIRKPLRFDDTFKKIKDMKAAKVDSGSEKPLIKAQAIWPAIRENAEEYYNTLAPHTDLIAFNPLIDYLEADGKSDIVYEKDFLCPQQYQRLVIGSDGKALMCSNDEMGQTIVGDANKETIYDIWHGQKLESIRKTHKEANGFMKISTCQKCYLPRMTEDKEVSSVNGREFIVKNYVNRRQVIGC